MDGFGWRAEIWRPSLEKRSVPCRLTVEVIIETGTHLPCETTLCGRQVYDLGQIGPDSRPEQVQARSGRAGHLEVSSPVPGRWCIFLGEEAE